MIARDRLTLPKVNCPSLRLGSNSALTLLVISIVALAVTGCSWNQGIHTVKWGHDGTYVFYNERTWSLPGVEHNTLYMGDTKMGGRTRIAKGTILLEGFKPSPMSRQVLLSDFSERTIKDVVSPSDEMAVVDAESHQKLMSHILVSPWPMAYGWHPSGNAIYFTDSAGIKLWLLGQKEPTLLVGHRSEKAFEGKLFAVCWSDDGKLLAYKTGKGRFDKNTLYVLDTSTGAHSTVASLPDGLYGSAFFSTDARFLFYTTYLHRDNSSTIRKLDISTGEESSLWRHGSDWVRELRRTRDGDSVILEHGPMGWGPGTVLILWTRERSEKVPCQVWDYHEAKDSFICLRTPNGRAEVIALSDVTKQGE
jgi:hypothetical protein